MKRNSITIGILLASVFFMSGCASISETVEQTSAWRDRAQETKSEAESVLAALVLERADHPDGSTQASMIDAAITRSRIKIEALNAAIIHADAVLQEASIPSDGLTKTTQLIAPYLPAPIQAPALLGAALLATLVRSRQLKSGTQSIIESIQHAINKDDAFKQAFVSNADMIRTIQTPLARKLVDRVQRA